MTKLSPLIILLFSVIAFTSCGQSPQPAQIGNYYIDSSIKSKIDKKKNTVDFKMFSNDEVVNDTYSKGKSIECFIMASAKDSTIHITLFAGMFAGFGCTIDLKKDSCMVRYFIKSDVEIYRLRKTDSLNFGISVTCQSFKLTLVNKSTFKNEEIIQGIVELTSDEFYEVANGKENKYKMQLTGYFTTDPIPKLSMPKG